MDENIIYQLTRLFLIEFDLYYLIHLKQYNLNVKYYKVYGKNVNEISFDDAFVIDNLNNKEFEDIKSVIDTFSKYTDTNQPFEIDKRFELRENLKNLTKRYNFITRCIPIDDKTISDLAKFPFKRNYKDIRNLHKMEEKIRQDNSKFLFDINLFKKF